MPYGDNLKKQKRYRAYLEIMGDLSERPLTRVNQPPPVPRVLSFPWVFDFVLFEMGVLITCLAQLNVPRRMEQRIIRIRPRGNGI